MKKYQELNESMIKNALKEGLITTAEARQMLMVYIKRSEFTPIRSKLANLQSNSSSRQPHHRG